MRLQRSNASVPGCWPELRYNGTIDLGVVGTITWYADADSDGYTAPDVSLTSCTRPAGYEEPTDADCDDTDSYPGAGDPPGDGIDQNCNGRDAPGKDGICGCATTTVPPSALGPFPPPSSAVAGDSIAGSQLTHTRGTPRATPFPSACRRPGSARRPPARRASPRSRPRCRCRLLRRLQRAPWTRRP